MKRIAQRGSLLISVIVALVILAAVSQILTLQQASRVELLGMEDNRQAAEYLAEAGLRHALRHARNSTNGQYLSAISGGLAGQGTYTALISPTMGSPITVTSTGTSLTGVASTVTRTYPVFCAGKTLKTAVVTAYDSKGLPFSIFESGGNNTANFLVVDKSSALNSAHTLIKFDLSSIPNNIPYESAELMLDVQQHDPGMEGGTLFVDRLTKAYDVSRVSWTNATANNDKWVTPGGDYTLVDEARTTIAATTAIYRWIITPMLNGWVNNTFPNNGLIVRTNVQSSESSHKLRLKKNVSPWPDTQWPRLLVKYCI